MQSTGVTMKRNAAVPTTNLNAVSTETNKDVPTDWNLSLIYY